MASLDSINHPNLPVFSQLCLWSEGGKWQVACNVTWYLLFAPGLATSSQAEAVIRESDGAAVREEE